MNAKTRFLNALHQQPVDRPPVAAVVTGITVAMMEKVGIYYPAAHHDAKQLAGLAASIWETTGTEAIKLPFGMTPEVEVLGLEIDFGTHDTLPTDIHSELNHPDELVIPDDFLERDRIPVVMEAISRLRERYDDEVAILSSAVGPFALSAKMFGFPNLFPWIINQPEYVHRVMDPLTGLTMMMANAELAAGSDVIILGEATCSGDFDLARNLSRFHPALSSTPVRGHQRADHPAHLRQIDGPFALHRRNRHDRVQLRRRH